ncbi:hypothetical protein TSAR_007514 [Trichomalopsis sarcophagae]|uniref:Uncharacterized protein n=1 Tax=Trichomalopsis sarcophagae TaxID=543379 RepID=A0A232EIZ7_9HYME|nr:hypothetical protein TSAR_007514 [Trichomalopsis sarcophagae]
MIHRARQNIRQNRILDNRLKFHKVKEIPSELEGYIISDTGNVEKLGNPLDIIIETENRSYDGILKDVTFTKLLTNNNNKKITDTTSSCKLSENSLRFYIVVQAKETIVHSIRFNLSCGSSDQVHQEV